MGLRIRSHGAQLITSLLMIQTTLQGVHVGAGNRKDARRALEAQGLCGRA